LDFEIRPGRISSDGRQAVGRGQRLSRLIAKPTRDLMGQMEHDLGTKLDWVAARKGVPGAAVSEWDDRVPAGRSAVGHCGGDGGETDARLSVLLPLREKEKRVASGFGVTGV